MTGRVASAHNVVAFWRAAGPSRWFAGSLAFDRTCRMRFLATHDLARCGSLDDWTEDATGALALLILLDQLPRNMFRGSPRTWASDAQARAVAEDALSRRLDRRVAKPMRQFFYLPLMHAEDVRAQRRSLHLYDEYGDANALGFARHHHDIVARFGRFPHRNAVLGRVSTPAEIAFLRTDAFRG